MCLSFQIEDDLWLKFCKKIWGIHNKIWRKKYVFIFKIEDNFVIFKIEDHFPPLALVAGVLLFPLGLIICCAMKVKLGWPIWFDLFVLVASSAVLWRWTFISVGLVVGFGPFGLLGLFCQFDWFYLSWSHLLQQLCYEVFTAWFGQFGSIWSVPPHLCSIDLVELLFLPPLGVIICSPVDVRMISHFQTFVFELWDWHYLPVWSRLLTVWKIQLETNLSW